MAMYTQTLMTILTSLAEETSMMNLNDYKEVIESARTKIFSFPYPIFNNSWKRELENKILKHYALYEIGFETFPQFIMNLDSKMNEIMPYYNKMYELQYMEIDRMNMFNLTEIFEGVTDKGGKETGNLKESSAQNENQTAEKTNETKSNGSSETNVDDKGFNKGSDTPQNNLFGVENDSYLTEYQMSGNTGKTENIGTSTSYIKENSKNDKENTGEKTSENKVEREEKTHDKTTKHSSGYSGKSVQQLLDEIMKSFNNIDMMIIRDLNNLFMGVL